MRILTLTNLYPNPSQPHRAAFNRLQLQALAREHQVQVIAPIPWTTEWMARRDDSHPDPEQNRTRICDGMIIHHPRYTFTPKVLRGWYGRFFLESVRDTFLDVARTFRPDVVLGCWAYPDGWAAIQLARECGLPVAIKVHGSDILSIVASSARQRRTMETLQGCDAVIAVSRHLAAQAIALGADPARVHTVYNGIDTRTFSPGPRDTARKELGIEGSDPLILFVGNLVPIKGLGTLVEALASLDRTGLRFQAALVGDGPLRGELKARIAALGLSGRVHVMGSCPQSQLPHWYRAAHVLVLPSRSEGIPNVLLEAAACGTPFVATRVGGIPEVSPATSLVSPGDPAELTQRILATIQSPDQSRNAPHVSPGPWAQSADALAGVLQNIVNQSRLRTAMTG